MEIPTMPSQERLIRPTQMTNLQSELINLWMVSVVLAMPLPPGPLDKVFEEAH